MAISDASSSYTMKMTMVAVAVLALSVISAILAVLLRIVLMTKLIKLMLRATNNMQIAGRFLKKQRLDPTIAGSIAFARGGAQEKEICEEYEKQFKKPVNLVANVFGIDPMTKDFVKHFDAQVLKTNKKSKSSSKSAETTEKTKKH